MYEKHIKPLVENQNNKQFVKFAIVGAFATIVNYSIFYWILKFYFKSFSTPPQIIITENIILKDYIIASGIGFISGIFAGFFLNKYWTFRAERGGSKKQFVKYFGVYGISLFLSLLFLDLVVKKGGLDPVIGNILAIGVTTMINFVGVKFFVFKVK